MLREQPYGRIPQSEYEAPIRFINEAGADLLATLNQMLDADAILTNDNYPIAETEMDVEEAINRVRTLLSATMNRPLDQLKLENKADVACIRFDPLRFSHLLKNMISNAVKFSPADTDVVIRLSRGANADLLLSVIDQGAGMSRETIDRALDPRPPGGVGAGGGLGFAIIRSICEAHRCVLSINSNAKTGSVVTVRMGQDRVVAVPAAAEG